MGFKQVTMKEICTATGMSRGGLYSHFSSTAQVFEALLEKMTASKFHVSRATLYNTMDLLTDAHLVIRHKFGNTSQYEKSYNMTTHFHRICMSCGTVTEVEDEKLRQVIESTHSKGFSIAHTALYMYGTCAKCVAARKRKEKRMLEQKNNK